MPRKVYVTDPKLYERPKIKEETKEEEAARIARRQLKAGDDVATRTGKKFIVDLKIGSGTMGEIYQVHPIDNSELKYAMKTEGARDDAPNKSLLRLKVETVVYKAIAKAGRDEIDKKQYVRMIDAGMTDRVKFFVMDLIWQPLHIVIGTILKFELSPHTKVSIARQTLNGIKGLHTIGFLHRDIKPSNFAVGLPPHQHIVYTLDFGIARDYIDKRGEMRVARERVFFMGTLPYAAIAGLQDKEQGRREDLESWLYMMMEIYDRKNLLWRDLDWDQKEKCIRLRKDLFKYSRYGVPHLNLPHAYYNIIKVIGNMGYYLKSHRLLTAEIEEILEILEKLVKDEKIDMSLPLDWAAICVEDVKRRKERDGKEEGKDRKEEGKDGREEKRASKDSKKKEKRRKERDDVSVEEIPDAGTDKKKKEKRSKSKSASKEKRRRHETQTEDDVSTHSDSDTGGREATFEMFKQWRREYKKAHGKYPDAKKKQTKDAMITAKDRDEKEKEKRVENVSLDDKCVSGPDLVKETRKDKKVKDKTIDEKTQIDEKTERKEKERKKDEGKTVNTAYEKI